MRRLTRRILEAISEMADMLEADGADAMQGYDTDAEREAAHGACMEAGSWAREQLNRRALKREARP